MAIAIGTKTEFYVSTVSEEHTSANTTKLNFIADSLKVNRDIETKERNPGRLVTTYRGTKTDITKLGNISINFSTYLKPNASFISQDKYLWESLLGRNTPDMTQPYATNYATLIQNNSTPLTIYLVSNTIKYKITGAIVEQANIEGDIVDYLKVEWKIKATTLEVITTAPTAYLDFSTDINFTFAKRTILNIDYNNTNYKLATTKFNIDIKNSLYEIESEKLGQVASISKIAYASIKTLAKFTCYFRGDAEKLKDAIIDNSVKAELVIDSDLFSITLHNTAISVVDIDTSTIWLVTFEAQVSAIRDVITLNQSVRLPNYKFKTIVNPNKYFKPKTWDIGMDWYTKIPAVIEEQPEPPPDWYLTSRLYNLEVADSITTNQLSVTGLNWYIQPKGLEQHATVLLPDLTGLEIVTSFDWNILPSQIGDTEDLSMATVLLPDLTDLEIVTSFDWNILPSQIEDIEDLYIATVLLPDLTNLEIVSSFTYITAPDQGYGNLATVKLPTLESIIIS